MWEYEKNEMSSLEDFPKDAMGFVYEIEHIPTGRIYIGKKNLYSYQNKVIGKRELEKLREERRGNNIKGRLPKKKIVIAESNWKKYYGSNKTFKSFVKSEGEDNFNRRILYIAKSKKELTYLEVKSLFVREVLEHGDKFFNDNIQGRFFKSEMS